MQRFEEDLLALDVGDYRFQITQNDKNSNEHKERTAPELR